MSEKVKTILLFIICLAVIITYGIWYFPKWTYDFYHKSSSEKWEEQMK